MVDNRQAVYDMLIAQGLSPNAALGALYSLGGESRFNLDPTATGAGGDYGIAQWTGPRKAALMKMNDPSSAATQIQMLQNELQGPYSNVLNQLKNTNSVADATRIWTGGFENPKVNNWQQRFQIGPHVGTVDAQGNFVPGTAASPNNTIAPANLANRGTAGTTLNTTPDTASAAPAAPAAPQQSPFQMMQQGNYGGALGALGKSGAFDQLGKALGGQQQPQLQAMQAPNIQPNRPQINPMLLQSMIQGPSGGAGGVSPLMNRMMMPRYGMSMSGSPFDDTQGYGYA